MHRVYCALRLSLPRYTRRRVPPRFRPVLVAPTRLNASWALDFRHDALNGGRRFRTLNVIDEGKALHIIALNSSKRSVVVRGAISVEPA